MIFWVIRGVKLGGCLLSGRQRGFKTVEEMGVKLGVHEVQRGDWHFIAMVVRLNTKGRSHQARNRKGIKK